MFTSKALEKLIENEDLESLLMRSALKPVGLPPDVEDLFVEAFCEEDVVVDNQQSQQSQQDSKSTKPNQRKRSGYRPRESIERAPKESNSSWYSRYLVAARCHSKR